MNSEGVLNILVKEGSGFYKEEIKDFPIYSPKVKIHH